ncbi:hypothetical protein [Sphingosinicella humi]|uniref:Uncharacterized protein n=1 Tax=Allosphingosinicella humi TaxID=2068657 RepID=A0A2U2J079_9SPHN|nr:hypothetical protein [Sphingosinicella humi]PWG01733.1 hypothetical protein DF286_01750 [Sphingosinicella humi]
MSDSGQPKPEDAPLNPALKSTTERIYDTSSSPAPVDTTSAKENEGEGWPIVWLVVLAICVALTLYFIF